MQARTPPGNAAYRVAWNCSCTFPIKTFKFVPKNLLFYLLAMHANTAIADVCSSSRPTLEFKLEREWQNEWEAHLTKEIVCHVPLALRDWMAAGDGQLHPVPALEMRTKRKTKAGLLSFAYQYKPVPNPYQQLHDVRVVLKDAGGNR